MPDKEPLPIVGKLPKFTPSTFSEDGESVFRPTEFTGEPILPGGQKSTKYTKGYTPYTDPFFSGGIDREFDSRMKAIEGGLDAVQPWYDKLGNGVVKFAGSFADGLLSTAGTIYGIPASLITWDKTQVWDNPLTNLGQDISDSVNEGFKNYRSVGEQNANAWSPNYWMTMNFLSDNIIGNLGFATAAITSGAGISKVLGKLAPYIAGRNLATGLDIINDGGLEALKNLNKAYSAVKRWDATQQAISVGISASGEASVEALSSYREAKQKMLALEAQKYGGQDNIPDSVLTKIEEDSKSVGNITYGLNLPILAGANMIQWGKSLSGFSSEFKQMSKNAPKVRALEEFGMYGAIEDQVKSGISKSLARTLSATGKALKSNLSEAGQEGAQFIASEGTKNWYIRDHDQRGWDAVADYTDPYAEALVKLVSTQEGVANLLGGFAGGAPFGLKDYVRAIAGDPKAKELMDKQLGTLNSPFTEFGGGTVRDNLKVYLKNMARHASAEHDLQDAIARGDEKGARSAKFDQLKSYINSRIQTGRMDLLEDEIDQLKAMGEEDFKSFFGLEENDNISKNAVLDKFKNTATEMYDTYKMMDRLFNPDMYRLNKLPPEERDAKMNDLHEYKQMLWSYMMDYKDRDQRSKQLDTEVGTAFANMLNIEELFRDNFKSAELNDLYRQYVASNVEHELNKAANPAYKNSVKESEVASLKSKLKSRINELTNNNPASQTTIEEFQGAGQKDFIEDYLFNVNKRIIPALNNPVVQTSIGKEDINQVITKTHDLVDLHAERRQAIYAYNQLAAVVKSGEFMGRYVNNPAYNDEKHKDIEPTISQKNDDGEFEEMPNPEYVPKRIPNTDLLNYNGYAGRQTERDNFYREQQIKRDENESEIDAFNANLDARITEELTEDSKAFHNKVSELTNGSENLKIKSLKTLSIDQLSVLQALANRNLQAKIMRGEFDVATKKDRDNFNHDAYISAYAQLKAANDEIKRRAKERADEIERKAAEVIQYVNANKINTELLIPGFKIGNTVVNPEIIKRAAAIIAETNARNAREESARKQAELAKNTPGPKAAATSNEEPIVDNEIYAQLKKDGKLDAEFRGAVFPDIAKKLANGDVLTPRENEVYQLYKEQLDKKVKAKYGTDPIYNVKIVTSGKYVAQEPIISSDETVVDVIHQSITETSQAAERIAPEKIDGAFIRLQRSDLQTTEDRKENEYDSEGNAIINQLTPMLFDASSPVNLFNKPDMRFRHVGFSTHGTKEEPTLLLEVRADNKSTWLSTNYFMQGLYDLKGQLINPTFSKDAAENKQKVEAFHDLLKDMQTEAVSKGSVAIETRGGISFGNLIENRKTKDGERERRGLLQSFGENINNIFDTDSVKLAVIFSHTKTDAIAVYRDERAPMGELTDINEMPGVYLPKALINAVANAGGKGTGNRGGQYVALLPTGQMTPDGGAQVHYPVLLSGKLLSAYSSGNYNIGSGRNKGTSSNIGEVLIDALLNPYKEEYNDLFPALFEMAGLDQSDYKGPDETNWKAFYTDANIHEIVNRVMFSATKTLDDPDTYKRPFKFEIIDTSEMGGAIMARIGIADALLKDRKTVDIFLSTKEGKIVKPQNDSEKQDFVQHRISQTYEFRKSKGKTDSNPVSYADIQDVIKDKAFHVQISRMSQSTPVPYTGFKFNETGKLITQTYPSYIHYVDDLGLAQATVQGLQDSKTGRRQYFVNQRVYLSKKVEVNESADPISDLFGPKGEAPKPKDVILGKGVGVASEVITGAKSKTKIYNKPSAKADANAKAEANRNPINAIAAANKIGNSRTRKKGMISLDLYKSINQRDMTTGGSVAIHARELIVDEITSILLDKMIDLRTKNRGSYPVTKLKAILKTSIGEKIYGIMQSARPSLEKLSYSEWENLEADHPDVDWLDESEENKLSELEYNQYQSLLNAYEYFDIDDFNKMFKAGEMSENYFNQIFLGGTREEPLFFIGYANRALAKLAELNVIKAVNNGNTEIELDEETGNYTQRFNDSWALQVNPKDTLGMQAKIFLNTIPQITIRNNANGVTEIVKQTSATGFNKYMKYDTAFVTLVNLGLNAQPEQFEYELVENPAYDLSPVIKAVRIKLAEIRSEKGIDLYNQVVRQLATTVTGLRMNTVTQLILNKNEGKPVFIKIFQGAKQNVNGQIVDLWQSQFSNAVSNNDYIAFVESYNENAGIFVTKPTLSQFNYEVKGKNGPEVKQGDFADIFTNTIKDIMQEHVLGKSTGKLTFNGYLSLAHLVHDMLGIQLVENDFTNKSKAGYGTAAVFQFIADSINSKNKEDRMFRNQLKKENIKSFDEFINRTFIDNLVKKVRQAVKDGTYNDDEPFRNSSTAMSLLSRMFQHYHQSIVNPQAKDANGKNQYVYVPADMLRHEFRRFQSPEHITQLYGLPILEFDYHINEQFIKDPNGERPDEFAPRSYWKNMRIEDINAMKLTSDIRKKRKGKNKGDVIEARKIPAGDVDILSMILFQNEEVTKSGDVIDRGEAKYFLPFGDSSAASALNFNKYGFQFDYNDGKLTIREGQVKDILYSHFKSEVNRIKNGFDVFNHVNNSSLSLDQKKQQLRKGYHYFERGDSIVPGAATRMYYFGRKNYDVTEGSQLYETMEVNGEIRPIGLREELFDQDGYFADTRLRPVFDIILNDFLSDIVNSKIQQMASLKDSFFELENPEMEGDKFASPQYKNNIIDSRYAESLKNIFTKSSTIDGKAIKDYGDREITLFDNPEQANENGYHAQLLKTAIIDQQVNALIANNLVRRMTWDFASFDENGNWDQFQQVLGKRESGFNSPYMVTATKSNVDVIIFNDVVYGNKKVNYANIVANLKPEEVALFAFMKNNGLGEYVTDKAPARYKELTAIHYAATMDSLPAKEIASIIKAALKSKLTDGGTIITLREYLFQMQQQGVITYADFGRLYNKYNNPDLKLTEEDKRDLIFKGQKMVGIGSVILADQKAPLYMKDAKIVLIPSQVKGTRYETIMDSLYQREDKSLVPSPGIQLAPVSAMKKHSGQVIDLFDQDDNIIPAAIANASVFSFPRGMYGEQVQNPTKEAKGITKGIQLQKYMFDNIYDDKLFAEDVFSGPKAEGETVVYKKAGKVYGKTNGRKIPEKGITKVELRDNMINILRHMHELKLQDLIDKFGLDYNITEEWKNAAREQGFDSMEAFQDNIDRLEQSKTYEEREEARSLNYIKHGLVARNIAKMINDVKQQAYTKKGIEISQLRALNEIQSEGDGGDKVERLRMALTFTPGNKQFQQVILAEIQNLFAHTKLNGFGGIQISSAGHERTDAVSGSTTLRGYGLKYDADDNVVGFDHAEIGIPWIFKDSSGKPLDYDKYVNEDGTPKTEMFDAEVLEIIGYRIPNTGLNMAGVFNVARFFKPGYTDSIMIPDILFSQMGTDLDFDKLYNYVYNYRIDKNGKVRKVQGVINPRQNNAKSILNSEESRRWAIHSSLNETDPGYRMKYKLFKQSYQKMIERLDELAPVTIEEPEQVNNIFIGMDPKDIADLKARLDGEKVTDIGNEKEREALLEQYKSIVDEFTGLQNIINKRKANFNHEAWLERRADNYLKAQSYQQLENAYFDIYNIVMSDMDMLPSMLHPLTSDMINDQVEEPRYNGKSISQMEASSIVEAPNTEVYQSKVRGDNKSSKENIGALANGQSTIDAMQTANISVGSKDKEIFIRPVVFRNNDNNIIEEDETDPVRFVTPVVNTPENTGGFEFNKMQYSVNKKTYAVPHRLARIYGVDGKTKVTSVVQSLLQSFLDFNNNRNVAYTNVNLATLNPLIAMITLGYTDHLFDFAAQEILVDYTKGFYAERSPFQKTNDSLVTLINNYAKRAGLKEDTFATYFDANDGDAESALHQMLIEQKLGDKQYNYERFFSPSQLHDMVIQRFNKKKSNYDINQLFILDMFLRLKNIGEPMFHLMQSINLESKGFSNVSILGAMDQINNHNYVGMRYNPINGKLSSPFLIGSERLGPWNKDENPNGMQSVYSLALAYAKKGMGIMQKNNGIFADLTPMFKHSRSTLSSMTGKRNLGNQERFNINIIQYLLSNPELYGDFLDVIPEADRSTAHDIRKHIFIDDLEITAETKNHMTEIKTKVLSPSLARRIEDIKSKQDPESKVTYEELYPILNYFRTTVKNNLAAPSWVKTENTAQFKERIGQESPANIQRMLADPNPEINTIAKYMFLYYYLGSGVTTPNSIGHLLPQEMLFTDDGFADKLNEMRNNLDRGIEALEREVNSSRTSKDYDKPWWFRQFDPNVVKVNRDASLRQLELYTQYLQNNPFEAEMSDYENGVHFEPTDTQDVVRITQKGKVVLGEEKFNPKSFIEVIPADGDGEKPIYNLYVINPDYNTYTRVNRSGTTNYVEFNYGNRFSPTLIQANQLRDSTVKKKDEISAVTLGSGRILADTKSLMPVQLDKENDLNSVFQLTFLNEDSRRGDEFIENPVEQKELIALAESIFPAIPANTKLIPYSIQRAKKDFQSSDGLVTVKGIPAFGSFRPGNPNGLIQIAYDFIDRDKKDSLLMKKVLLHESAHAATYNVFKVLEKLQNKQLTKSEVSKLLGLDKNTEEGPIADVQTMLASYKKYKELFDYLKSNTALRKAYVKANGNENNKKGETNDLGRLNIIMEDIDEFTARLFNDKPFRDALKAIPYNKKTIFDRILDLLKDILGLQPGTAAYHAFGNLMEILEPVKGSKVAAEGWKSEDVDKIFSANGAIQQKALLQLQDMYADVSNFNSRNASPEELNLYDRLVKEGKIIC